jgi:hypothetical protein
VCVFFLGGGGGVVKAQQTEFTFLIFPYMPVHYAVHCKLLLRETKHCRMNMCDWLAGRQTELLLFVTLSKYV